jgi:diguanylate cyclase (GGDEF)-like protein
LKKPVSKRQGIGYNIIRFMYYRRVILSGNKTVNLELSQIIHMLEDSGTFVEVSKNIIEQIVENVQAQNAVIMQISADGKGMHSIVEAEDVIGSKLDTADIKENCLCAGKLKRTAHGTATDEERKMLALCRANTCISVPIEINNVKAMYLFVMGDSDDFGRDESVIEYIEDAAMIIHSIAQSKVINNSLISSYDVLQKILDNIGSGIIVCSKSTGNILFENDMASHVSEVRETIRECLEEVFKNFDISGQLGTPMERYNTESGLWFEVRFSELKWIDGSDVVVATASDITQKKKNQQKIEYQAHNDFLTGLYNRMKCEVDLRKVIRRTEKAGLKGAVLFIDLDDFKHINDGLGHQYGDILLQQIAAGLTGIPGLRGHCYRMGGDEFIIIIGPELYDELGKMVAYIKTLFNKPWYLMETEYFCTMSMGIAVFPDNSVDVHEITRMADVAMYEAKRSGKNGYAYYSSEVENSTAKRLDIENNMRQAVSTGIDEFVVFYQPVVNVNTQMCTSCEALVRWDSKALGFMGPGEFIPLAEYLGLITSIGDYVLEEACRRCKLWNDNGHPDFYINVNLSVVQLLQKNVVENIKRILDKTGVNPKNIVLEITESFAINDMQRVMDIITGLKKLGPRIALDDFGTGYSSLNYIKQLPLDIIKVDKTFIDDIVEDDYAQAFIKLIVDLSKTIGTKIVVEGVEHKEQFELLKSLGVDYIQGYYFGKPVPANIFEEKNLEGRLGE